MTCTGADALLATLADAGVTDVFGLPGSQTVQLYEGLRRSRVRSILATSELAAAFMANGYFRASGRTAVVFTIPGPGFAYALPGIAEAFLDSAAMLWITIPPAESPGNRFQLQAIDQLAMAKPIVKHAYRVRDAGQMRTVASEALARASQGEPGPVLLEIDASALESSTSAGGDRIKVPGIPNAPADRIGEVLDQLATAGRVAFLAGAGTAGCAADLRALAESLHAPVVTSTSGRGVLPEGHPLLIVADPGLSGAAAVLNPLFERCDLIVAIGWKGSHNSTNGFRLRLPPERLVHVDASSAVLGANYPARLAIECDAGAFLRSLLADERLAAHRSRWTDVELADWRVRGSSSASPIREPVIDDGAASTARDFFSALGRVLPAEACVVTDSGLHQMLARRYLEVQTPRGLIVPTNFQSMGFGLPAAIGAKLAAPDRTVVAIVGDGSLAISGTELMTAVRERLALTIVLFNDESLGLIRLGQLAEFGHAHATELVNPDYAGLAESMGVRHLAFAPDRGQSAEDLLRDALGGGGVTLLEVRLRDSAAIRRSAAVASARTLVRRAARSRLIADVRRWTKRQ